jgi:hypothetical protein
MTTRLGRICLTAMLFIGSIPSFVRAQGDAFSNATLKGIGAVFVVIEDLPDGAKVLGLTREMLQTDVELKLRLAGIRVATEEEGSKLPGAPHIYTRVNLTDRANAASIEVNLEQNVLLERNGDLLIGAVTWQAGGVLGNPTAQGIRDRIKDLADEFLNDWLSVNPKK